MAVQGQLPTKDPCRLCKKICTEPKFLPCKHVFCRACLRFQIITVPANLQWEGFSCPFCKKYTKAIDPDQALALWADQFPDIWQPKKRNTSRQHPTKPQSPSIPQTLDKANEATDVVGSSGALGSAQTESPITVSRDLSVDERSSTSTYGSVTSEPMSPATFSETSLPASPLSPAASSPFNDGHTSLSDWKVVPEPTKTTPSSTSSLSDVTDGPDATQSGGTMTLEGSQGHSDVQDSLNMFTKDKVPDSDVEICTIHPWKPVIVTCKKCVSVACGQCLTESHRTCRAEDFDPVSDLYTLPNMSKLETEANKVNSFTDLWASGARQLEQTRVELRQKISQMADMIIQDTEKEKEQMVKRVQQLYRDEIWRLKSGINPSETLLNEVKQVKNDTDSLSTQHPTQILLRADSILAKQKALLEHLGTVDFACVPPEINFVENNVYNVSLGDLVVDPGFYPKHDACDAQLEAELSSVAISGDGDSTGSSSRDGTDQGVTSDLGQTSHPKKKNRKSSLSNLFSPTRKPERNSTFYVDVQ